VSRVLYIATRRKSAQLQDLFDSMKSDMASGSVELIIDRRYTDRRIRSDTIVIERRSTDRRRYYEKEELTRSGWVRLVIDD
jgi:hypothetical protein